METPEVFMIRQLERGVLEAERERIRNVLRSALPFANVREAGSTAVDGVIGKQDIDFAVSVLDVAIQLFHAQGRYDVFGAFIRLLIEDPDLRRAYNELKNRWNGKPMPAYRAAKDAFIEAALKRANPTLEAMPVKPAAE